MINKLQYLILYRISMYFFSILENRQSSQVPNKGLKFCGQFSLVLNSIHGPIFLATKLS